MNALILNYFLKLIHLKNELPRRKRTGYPMEDILYIEKHNVSQTLPYMETSRKASRNIMIKNLKRPLISETVFKNLYLHQIT